MARSGRGNTCQGSFAILLVALAVFATLGVMLKPIITLAVLLPLWAALATERTFQFGDQKLNEPPQGFRSAVTGSGQAGDWRIVLDDAPALFPPISPNARANNKRAVLAQLARDRTDDHFPMLVLEGEEFGDFSLSTRFKIVDGAVEQMAGIAFHIRDDKNYYYVRASALGTNLSFFKMINGVPQDSIAARVEIPRGIWQELTVECKGNQIRGLLNGKELILVQAVGTHSLTSGRIGFWTKSDSVCYFTDSKITYTPKEVFAQVLIRDALEKYPRLKGLQIFAATPGQSEPRLIASNDPREVGQLAAPEQRDVLARGVIYHGKTQDLVMVTMPLHDANGETVAAVRVVMRSFFGQTEKNAIGRALPIIKRMEARVKSAADLLQ